MKRVKRFLLLFLSFTLFIMPLCVCVCVVRVHADDSPTYAFLDAGCYYIGKNAGNSLNSYVGPDRTVRAAWMGLDSNNKYKFVMMLDEQFYYRSSTSDSSCGVTTYASTEVPNHPGYYYLITGNKKDINQMDIPGTTYTSDNATQYVPYMFDLIYGDNSVDPAPEITYGLVDLKGYQTNVAGSGNAAINNVDVISWDDTFDTLSNDITEGNVRIRYVPGHYKAVDKTNLLQQLYTDFILDVVIDDAEGLYPVTDGSASFRWGQVIEDLSIPFYSIYNLSNSAEGWIKRGWIYQVRLEIGDHIGEWQTVYSSTSSGVSNDMEIVNTTTITQNTINAIQQVNTINDTTNIWIIYETPVDPSPEYQPPENDDEKPWWIYLLEMINNSIGVTNQYISEGTDESVQVVNNINNNNDTLNQTVNEYDNIEDDLITDFNDNTENIDLDDTLIGNNGFLNAARWISEQFTTITTDNPFGAILKFSLVLGFVLIFLGRFR